MASPVWRTVGSVELLFVEDGRERVPPRFLFADAPDHGLTTAFADSADADRLISVPIGCLILRREDRVALIDSGTGRFAELLGASTGGLEARLHEAGIGRDEIEVVVITHAHPDHVGGLVIDGELAFRSARHLIGAPERPFWTDPETSSRLPDFMADMPTMVEGTFAPLQRRGLLQPVAGQADILPGVRTLPAPGHTPGHLVVEIASKGARAVFLADAVLHEIGFAHPDWAHVSDADPAQATRTRRTLLDQAAADEALVLASHLERPGTLTRCGAAFAFRAHDQPRQG